MGTCLRKYPLLRPDLGRRLTGHLVASKYAQRSVLVTALVNDDDPVQLVITGDFFQLPPVTKGGEQPFFAFECGAWKACIEHTVTLTQVFRQKDDSTYLRPGLGNRQRLSIRRICSTTERAASRLHHAACDTILSRPLPPNRIERLRPSTDRALPHAPRSRTRQLDAPRRVANASRLLRCA